MSKNKRHFYLWYLLIVTIFIVVALDVFYPKTWAFSDLILPVGCGFIFGIFGLIALLVLGEWLRSPATSDGQEKVPGNDQ